MWLLFGGVIALRVGLLVTLLMFFVCRVFVVVCQHGGSADDTNRVKTIIKICIHCSTTTITIMLFYYKYNQSCCIFAMTHDMCCLFLDYFLCCVTPIFGPLLQNVDKMKCVLCCVDHFQYVAKNFNSN